MFPIPRLPKHLLFGPRVVEAEEKYYLSLRVVSLKIPRSNTHTQPSKAQHSGVNSANDSYELQVQQQHRKTLTYDIQYGLKNPVWVENPIMAFGDLWNSFGNQTCG